jgi:hypothetical protein
LGKTGGPALHIGQIDDALVAGIGDIKIAEAVDLPEARCLKSTRSATPCSAFH